MSFTLERTTAASVKDTLHAIQHSAAYWQESWVPPELKKRGALGVNADIKGRRFRLYMYDMSRDPPATFADLRGDVEDAPGGGARIVARVGLIWSPAWRYIPLAAIAILALLSQSWLGALLVTGVLIIVVAIDRARDEGITERDDGARHLVERLDAALAALPPAVAARDAAQRREIE